MTEYNARPQSIVDFVISAQSKYRWNEPHEIKNNGPDDLKVGQIWEKIEDKCCIVLISLVRPGEIRGHMFNGFEVVQYYSLDLYSFCRYWQLVRDRK